MTESRDGRIITFYSYKGGVGRTMALANVAWILAANGHRVLAVDWDLETPGGLPRYFKPFLPTGALGTTTGLIDLFADFADAARRRGRPDEGFYQRHAEVEHAMSVKWAFPGSGWLNCLSAGRQDRDYHATLQSFRWDELDARFLEALRERWRRDYDFVLIDSRSGMGSAVDICIRELPDTLVSCFTLNSQSLDGAALTAQHVIRNAPGREIRVLPVPMRVNTARAATFDAGRALARMRFAGLPHGVSAAVAHQYWEENRIPQCTGYEHEEVLATFKDRPGETDSLLSAYERLTSAITSGRVTRLPELDERLRKYHLGAYARPLSPEATPLVLFSVPRDRMWADWVRHVLTQAGFQVVPSAFDAARQNGAAPRTVILLSSAYLRSPRSRTDWPLTHTSQPPVLLRIDDTELVPLFAEYTPVELTDLDEEQARTAVLGAVGGSAPASDIHSAPSFPNHVPLIGEAPPRNPRFVGRDSQLDMVHDALGVSHRVAVQATGAGMGRRQLAVEYVHRFRADYDLMWWVPAVDRRLAMKSLARLAATLKVSEGDSTETAARNALSLLGTGEPFTRWLLVYDNAASPEELAGLLPSGPGRVLLTVRDTEWEARAHTVVLDQFAPIQRVELLRGRLPDLSAIAAADLVTAVGEVSPLVLDQVGAWLAATGSGTEECLSALGLSGTETVTDGPRPVPAEAPTRLAQATLRERSPAAYRLLQMCCCFWPMQLSLNVLYGDAAFAVLRHHDPSLRMRSHLEAVVDDLVRYCLAEIDHLGKKSLRVHRLVRATVLQMLTPDEHASAQHDLYGILDAASA
ncbi:cellulose biosynthesis protein BcsQ [Streptomyces sp. SAI-208]|uniref:KGGVGR-motif variant AAA ATPase n=1 Tax=Streptomyces sp. SAI-208 TaxID=2940550 RepID=UPI002474B68E|nr:AAA family ATPase [Streptomyces sp. SAI-208]MDH6610950.1 cellulose biosynthesis protein BcsQ [Streptomyces sp. SAI-208]